jgi:aldose 1-epimerase
MKITTEPFGASRATLINITNDAGSVLALTDLGASIVGLKIPARRTASAVAPIQNPTATSAQTPAASNISDIPGSSDRSTPSVELIDVVLGYGDYDDYASDDKYLGATVGRYANRIARGELTLGDASYGLDKNQDGKHTLHSGSDGWHLRIWQYSIGAHSDSVAFCLRSPDGDQKFPGNADINVTYTFTDDNTVRISYHAVSDADTVFNLTNHSYFNLDGEGAGSILDHRLRVNASRFTPTDADSIPTGEIRDVDGSALDFRREKRIGRDIDSGEEQLALAHGYDHNFVLDRDRVGGGGSERSAGALREAAVVRSEVTGIEMTVRTDMPGVQFYSGNYLGTGGPSKSGAAYERRSGFCLETQFFPDSPHHANFPSTVFRAGEAFDSVTEYAFAVSTE